MRRTAVTRGGPLVAAGAILLPIVLVGCSLVSGPAIPAQLPSLPVQPPVDAAYDWFAAINDGDLALVAAHIAPERRKDMWRPDWFSLKFRDVRCELRQEAETTAWVQCTFSIASPPDDLADVTFWNIDFERQSPGPWLMVGYGWVP